MSAGPLEPEPIEAEEFRRPLSVEYDVTLVRLDSGGYWAPGAYCSECGALNSSVFASDEGGIRDLTGLAGPAARALGGDGPEAGAIACVECGAFHGCDLQGESVRVLDGEDYRHYSDFRRERGEPL